MRSFKKPLVLLVSTLVTGCGDTGADAPEQLDGVGYVLLDLAAREAGFRLDGASATDASMPIEVEVGRTVDLVGAAETILLDVAHDELVWVRGERGVIEHRAFDDDVSRDVLFVNGSEAAAKAMAAQLDGSYETDDDGLWRIQAASVYETTSQIDEPDGLTEVVPAVAPDVADLRPMADDDTSAETRRRLIDAVAPKPLLDFDITNSLPIHELVMPPVSCSDRVTGIWVSRRYFPAFDDWYVFTLEIRRDSENPSQLTGRIRSRSWSGNVAVESPRPCDMLRPSKMFSAFDLTVTMQAQGTSRDDHISFGGTSWRAPATRCGPRTRWYQYNLDQFTGVVSEDGRWMHGLNNDGARSFDDEHEFRRISCL